MTFSMEIANDTAKDPVHLTDFNVTFSDSSGLIMGAGGGCNLGLVLFLDADGEAFWGYFWWRFQVQTRPWFRLTKRHMLSSLTSIKRLIQLIRSEGALSSSPPLFSYYHYYHHHYHHHHHLFKVTVVPGTDLIWEKCGRVVPSEPMTTNLTAGANPSTPPNPPFVVGKGILSVCFTSYHINIS